MSGTRRVWQLPALLGLLLYFSIPQADIYRYQDAEGGWHFTDAPPPDSGADLVPGYAQAGETPPAGDLVAQLESGFDAVTPIARATLAVVTIKSGFGEGSGFFCTSEGHILTNRHVIRPSEGTNFQVREQTLTGQEQDLQGLETELNDGRRKLRLMKKDLEGYERVIKGARDGTTRDWAKNTYARVNEQYQKDKTELDKMRRKLDGVKRDLRRNRRDLDWERGSEATTSVFDLVLKDGTEMTATLVDAGTEQDLALLKLDGFRTPFLRLDRKLTLSQGQRVFAIGNPLGMHDSVTSGVITRITPEYVHTDVQILPGNSGGPLITEDGGVVGINVARDVPKGTSMYTVGFGKTIPVELALKEFPQIQDPSGERRP